MKLWHWPPASSLKQASHPNPSPLVIDLKKEPKMHFGLLFC
jgi:hypothetical protein